jgi:ketosteroid isomerase-like protein
MAIMTGELERTARELLQHLDQRDFQAILRLTTDDAQGIDELSRRWIRSKTELAEYVRQLEGAVANLHSELNDIQERTYSDTGLLTCWLEQDYTHEGKPQHVSAPTTILFRRENGTWKIALIHSVPLPAE